ncbi:lipopolysaccharide biosynthesis protein, partial [Streptomyces sp. A108]|nr:lipopolysaccharide biosynthesis protein [Streptomyces sp. A108]
GGGSGAGAGAGGGTEAAAGADSGAGTDGRAGTRAGADGGPVPQRRLRPALWLLLGLATVAFLVALRHLAWLDGAPDVGAGLTGQELLRELPLSALAAGAVLLVVFVAAVTLCATPDPWLPGTALGAAVLALHAAPVALGREPEPVGGAAYAGAAGFLADALGLDGPGPVLRWGPLVLQLLCLIPLWLLLDRVGDRLSLPWQGRWGVLYLAAVGGWVWREELAPAAPPVLLLLGLAALLASVRRRPAGTDRPALAELPPASPRNRPNGTSRH